MSRLNHQVIHTDSGANQLCCGQSLELSGTIYTARDAAAKRMLYELEQGIPLPFAPQGAFLYFAGPTGTPPGHSIGAIGPTTSGRMERYLPKLLALGFRGFIGKGGFCSQTAAQLGQYGGVYLCAVGGAGALYANCVKRVSILAYPELGCEAVRELQVTEMPLICGIDSKGNSLFSKDRME